MAATIDDLYERDLREATPTVELWVKFVDEPKRRVRVWKDTPENQREADKRAFDWIAIADCEWAKVTPVEAGGESAHNPGKAPAVPASTRVPSVVYVGRGRLSRGHDIETRRYGLDDELNSAVARHPANGILTINDGEHCPAHPGQDLWTCEGCAT